MPASGDAAQAAQAAQAAIAETLPWEGRLVAVWGPTGAPGRTAIAVTLATEAATLGCATLLADADSYGGVVAQVLGLLDESPGLAAAVRQANVANLDLNALAKLARVVTPQLRVLTGIARADRWPELRPAGLTAVYALARRLAALTVAAMSSAAFAQASASRDPAPLDRSAPADDTAPAPDNDTRDAPPPRDQQRSAAAEGNAGEFRRIVTALDRHQTYSAGHARISDPDDRFRRLHDIEAERFADMGQDRALCGFDIETCELAADRLVGIDAAHDDMRVSQGRTLIALAVTGRPGL